MFVLKAASAFPFPGFGGAGGIVAWSLLVLTIRSHPETLTAPNHGLLFPLAANLLLGHASSTVLGSLIHFSTGL